MKSRCNNKNHPRYAAWGGRGIRVCAEWNMYSNFAKWAQAAGYKEGLTIDRIDNDAGYCPGNCRWTTKKAQANNTRKTVIFTLYGVSAPLTAWAAAAGLPLSTVRNRRFRHWDVERTLAEPARPYNKGVMQDAGQSGDHI